MTANEYLVLAGTLHGVHAITSKLSPTGKGSGVQVIEGEDFKLNIMLTLTGTSRSRQSSGVECLADSTKPLIMTQVPSSCSSHHYPTQIPSLRFRKSMKLVSCPRCLVWLKDSRWRWLIIYHRLSWISDSDAVMKNPFYTLEMPINVNGFDERIRTIVASTVG